MPPTFRRCLVLLVVVANLAPSIALGQSARAGVVTTLEGNVTVTSASLPQPRPLKFRDDVFVNDRVVTGDRSIARMLLAGKAVVTVRERSALTITEVPGKSTIELSSGKIAVAVAREKMKPGDQIEVRTPNAVAGVRGTVFVAEVTQASASLEADPTYTTFLYGFSGLVLVTIGNQVFNLTGNTVLSRIGTQPPALGPMTVDLRNRAQAGLSTKTQIVGGAGQQATNEEVVKSTTAALGSSMSAVAPEGGGASLLSTPQGLTAPILPGGASTIIAPPPPPVRPAPPRPSNPGGR
jgi:hypothetical protein